MTATEITPSRRSLRSDPSGMAIAGGGIGSHFSASGMACWIQDATDPGDYGASIAELA